MTTVHFYKTEGRKKVYKYFVNCFSQAEIDYYISVMADYKYELQTIGGVN